MKTGQATGMQVAFLMFAVMLVAVPLSNAVIKLAALDGVAAAIIEKGGHFGFACIVIAAFPRLRRFARQSLSSPVTPSTLIETLVVAIAALSIMFATAGALAAWFWATQGPERVDRMIVSVERDFERAFSPTGLVRIAVTVLVAPVVEELVFRGFIYRAFERQWGWFVSMIVTSALFGLYHPYAWSAFTSSVLFVCMLRRTGSLRAPILAHTLFNLMLWWPLLGQHVFPYDVVLSDPATWYFHFACLAFVVVALPIYVWMSRDRHVIAPTVFLAPDAAVQK